MKTNDNTNLRIHVKLKPHTLRSEFLMAAMEDHYAERLLSLFRNSAGDAQHAHDQWVNLSRPVYHKWSTYNKIALEDICHDFNLLPSETKLLTAVVTFDTLTPR